MGLSNILLLSQLTGHIVTLILSLCITIPMSIHEDDFRGYCLLFSVGEWQETDGQFKVDWASQGFCNYTIFVGVFLFVVSAVQVYRLSLLLYRGQDSSFVSAFIDVVASALLACLTIIAALMITLGFDFWCKSITKRFETCGDAQDNDIDKKDGIDTSSFYIQMGVAQFGAWASWATSVGLLVFATLKLWRYHQEENMRVSMAIARERLIKNACSVGGGPSSSSSSAGPASNGRGGGGDANKNAGAAGKRGGNDPAIHSI
ncbi:transmembrane protein 179 [Folsomia candida]|uniref:Transmembrane protein 179 n=1 Tax=Folsomia candida TaxID=158441 RepID=A0A226DCJ5_FOLCA|nr:transmembrane protein 179 [Folsomia candida]OXA42648.1 hypothetical protein Fcan01_22550 [Folsomia candida]